MQKLDKVAAGEPALAAAYRATAYRATVPQAANATVVLRVGERHPALDTILRRLGARRWAYVSACNPGSRRLSAGANAVRTSLLAHCAGRHWPGVAIADGGDWPPEASLLLPDASLERAWSLAAAFGQNAFLYGELGGPARLIWTADRRRAADGDRMAGTPRGKA